MKLKAAVPLFYGSKLNFAKKANNNNSTNSIPQNSQKSNFGMYDRGLLYGISFKGLPKEYYDYEIEHFPSIMKEQLAEEFPDMPFSLDLGLYIYYEIKDCLEANKDEIPNPDEVLKGVKEKCGIAPDSWVTYTDTTFDPRFSVGSKVDRDTENERLDIISGAIKGYEKHFKVSNLKEESNELLEHLMKDHNEEPSFEFSSDEIDRFRRIMMANLEDPYKKELSDVLKGAIEARRQEELEEIAKRRVEQPELNYLFDEVCEILSKPLSDDEFEYFKEAIFASFHKAGFFASYSIENIMNNSFAQECEILKQEPSERLKQIARLIFREDRYRHDIKHYEETLFNYLKEAHPELPMGDDEIKNMFSPVYQDCKKVVDDKIKEINKMTSPIITLVQEATDDELKDNDALFKKIEEQYPTELEKYIPRYVMKNLTPELATAVMISRMLEDETAYQKIKGMIEDYNSEFDE